MRIPFIGEDMNIAMLATMIIFICSLVGLATLTIGILYLFGFFICWIISYYHKLKPNSIRKKTCISSKEELLELLRKARLKYQQKQKKKYKFISNKITH